MSNSTPSRLGMVNGTGADDALFLKLFGGEVLTEFAATNVFLNLGTSGNPVTSAARHDSMMVG